MENKTEKPIAVKNKKVLRVRVANKDEFYSLLKHLDKNQYTPHNSETFRYDPRWPLVTYEDNYFNGIDEEWLMDNRKYDTIDFSLLSDLLHIPLLKNETELNLSGLPLITVSSNGVTIGVQDESYLGSRVHLDILDMEAIIKAYNYHMSL